jgi:uncharacterized peroxidase-related enzyme
VFEVEEKHVGNIPEQRRSGAANLSIVEEEAAGEDVQALYREFRSRFGRADLPGIVKCFATNPAVLKSMIDLAAEFLFIDGHLSRRQKEMIATLVSAENGCPYCANSHGNALLAQGGSTEVLCALQTGAVDSNCFVEAERVLMRFALKVNSDSRSVTRAEVEKVMQAGWTEPQLAETVHFVALFAAFNRIANSFGLPAPDLRLS